MSFPHDWFFILAASGQMIFCLWMLARYLRAEPAAEPAGP